MALGRLVRNKPPLILCLGAVGPGEKVYRSVPTTQCAEATAAATDGGQPNDLSQQKGDPKDYMSGKRTFTLGSGQRICESATHQI